MNDRSSQSHPNRHGHHPDPGGHKNVSEWERWGSGLAGGSLVSYGLNRGGAAGVTAALIGAGLLKRAISGQCELYSAFGIDTAAPAGEHARGVRHEQGIKVHKAISIGKSQEELYSFFRNFDNLPKFMQHLESVKQTDSTHSHWVARGPFGHSVEWDAEIIHDEPNKRISWRSLEGADVDSAGSVKFIPAPAGRGTEVHVTLSYQPPFGRIGATVAKFFGEEPAQQIEGDLRHFKQLMETGVIPTIEGQPSDAARTKDPAKHKEHSPQR